ncbi:MAG: HD domain-containing protein [Anaerosomatales bacterium]|nr:HD domain-containing protein [Anaerosomatales bacterium]GAV32319.1 predicted HD-superfamily hydrolase [Coriobacteriaceae bacterium EMTCatB1]
MKTDLAATLTEGRRVDSVFSLRARELRSTRHGEAYLALELADRSGTIAGVMFKPDALAASIPAGTVVHVLGIVTTYRGVKRISIDDMRPAERYDVSDLLPRSARERKESVKELRRLVEMVEDPGLSRLLRTVFGDVTFFRSFAALPASIVEHHAGIGGLLEHTVAVATACVGYQPVCPGLDRDLLLAGALLHDVGVVDAIRLGTGFEPTVEGRMLGHAVLGERRVNAACAALRDVLSVEKAAHLSHLVLSHHRSDFGYAVAPSSLEALVLSHIDALDREASAFAGALKGALRAEEEWTDASNQFGRPLYAGGASGLRTA